MPGFEVLCRCKPKRLKELYGKNEFKIRQIFRRILLGAHHLRDERRLT